MDIIEILHKERIDEETFLLLSLEALQGLGIPLGPRLQLLNAVKRKQAEKDNNTSNNNVSLSSSTHLPTLNGSMTLGANGGGAASSPSYSSLNALMEEDKNEPQVLELMQTLRQNFPNFLVLDPADVELFFENPLGSGGFGQVYESRIGGIKPAAAKLFTDIKDGLSEGVICQRLHHKNIISLAGVSCFIPRRSANVAIRQNPRLLLLMELADTSLHQLLTQRASTLEWELVERFALQIAEGLSYLHSEGVIHLDLKPQNILMTNSILKICDFGISRKKRSMEQTHTVVTRVALSYVWSAPEQQKNREVSPRNDCYSFGAILFWMIAMPPANVLADSNKPGMDATEIPKMLIQALDDGAARDGCPEILLNLCRRCLNVDPKLRPADGREILSILDGGCLNNELVRGITSNSKGGGASSRGGSHQSSDTTFTLATSTINTTTASSSGGKSEVIAGCTTSYIA